MSDRDYPRTPRVTNTDPLPDKDLRALVRIHTYRPWAWTDPAQSDYIPPPADVVDPCGDCSSAKALHPFPYLQGAGSYEQCVRAGAAILALTVDPAVRVPMVTCPQCGGSGHGPIIPTHGCGGDEARCLETCPVPMPTPCGMCAGGGMIPI